MMVFSLLIWLATHLGCTTCQSLCNDMADLAEECGYEVTNEMIASCKEQQADSTREDNQDCRAVQPKLRQAWNCDELEIYFGNTTSDDTASN